MPTFEDYLAQMATYARGQSPELTDLLPGSVYRSILEAVAVQLELIQFGTADLADTAIREAAYQLWNFDRRAAQAASGTVRLTATETVGVPVAIPAGTQFRVPGTDRVYRTLSAASFPAGSVGATLDLLVASIGTGVFYNTVAATIREFVAPLSTNLSVTNPSAFTNGKDEETDDERLQRFATFVRSLHRATAESLEYAAEQATVLDGSGIVIEAVKDSRCLDIGAGLARCHIANGTTAPASSSLINAVATNIALYKAAGVTVNVQAATLILQAITAQVRLLSTVTLTMVKATINDAIGQLIGNLKIGDVLYVEQIRHAIMGVPGVIDCIVTVPAANTDPTTSGQVVLSGTPVITQL